MNNKQSSTQDRNSSTEVINRLERLGKKVKAATQGKWQAQCPAHEDNHASLTITEGSGKLLLYCHARCSYPDIVAALGFDDKSEKYHYQDRHGKTKYTITRTADKQFPASQPDGTTNIQGVDRVLYNLPAICASNNGDYIFLVEGEQDVDTLTSYGLLATCNPSGAGKWKSEYNKDLADRNVVLLPDNDPVGIEHMEHVAKELTGTAKEIRIVKLDDLPPKGDITDWMQTGGTVDALMLRVKEARVIRPEPTSWLDVITLSDVQPEDIEWLWENTVPKGTLTGLNSLEGIGKTHVAADMTARVTGGIPWPDTPNTRNPKGDVILYSREEHLTKTTLPRLIAMGADVSRVHVVQTVKSKDADDSMFELEYNIPELDRLMAQLPKTRLVIFDPITQYVAGNENSNHDIQRALDKLNSFAERHNVAVLMLSHFNKKQDARFINRTIGSRAWSAGPRMIWGLEFDPNGDNEDVYMTNIKCNIGPRPKGFRFHISGPTGKGQVYWDIARTTRIMGESAEKTTKLQECCEWLKEKLDDDAKVPAAEIFDEGDDLGFNEIMLKRAKKEMDVISVREGFGKDSVSYWQNPVIHTVSEREL